MTEPKFAPSILSADFARLAEAAVAVERAGADWIHVDVMDGHFVPNLTFGPKMVADLSKATRLPLDVHLMIERPEDWVDRYADAGATYLTIHVEASNDVPGTLAAIRGRGVRAGVPHGAVGDVPGKLEPAARSPAGRAKLSRRRLRTVDVHDLAGRCG